VIYKNYAFLFLFSIYSFFFQEKTLGGISFKLETKIMNFMTVFFFENNIIKLKCCQYYAIQFVYNFPIIRPLCRVWVCFYCLHHVFQILSVILTKYHYIILTDYPGIQFHKYVFIKICTQANLYLIMMIPFFTTM
jgi:hypothetical protein